MADLIDRQKAIDELIAFKEAHKADRFTGDFLHWTGIKAMIENLPSIQPELANNSPKLDNKNGELINRQDAIDIVRRYNKSHMILKGKPMIGGASIVIELEDLPSAQPERKKGKWVGKERFVNSPEFYSWQCSVCGCVLEDPTLDKPYPFCPNCGADMREGDAE